MTQIKNTQDLQVQKVAIDSLKAYKGNPRRGNIEVIRESLRRYGQYRPVIVRKRTKEVLAGNHTWLAAKAEGWDDIWATFLDCDAQTAKRIVAIDNRASDLATYDESELVALLGSLPDLHGTGWDTKTFDRMASQLTMGVGGDPVMEDASEAPRTQLGDLWILGEHRLLCGDSSTPEAYERLLQGEQPVCLWTDPPYGTGGARMMKNNTPHRLQDFLSTVFERINAALAPGAALYLMFPNGKTGVIFGHCYLAQGWRWCQTLVWLKDSMTIGQHDYHYQHEMLINGFKYDAELLTYGYTKCIEARGRTSRAGKGWEGSNKESSVIRVADIDSDDPVVRVIEVEKSRTSTTDHPTPRPSGLVEHCLVNSTKKADLVLDPFDGSGATLIACENIRRRCRAIEINPKWVDVAVGRWESHTGMKAEVQHA